MEKEVFILPSGCKAFRLMLWSHSQICSVNSRARNSHFKRARHSFASPASRPSPSACLHGPATVSTGLEGMGLASQHRTPQPRLYTCTGTHFHTVPFLQTLEHWSLQGHPARGAPRGSEAPAEPNGSSEPLQPVRQGCRQAPGMARGLQRQCSHQSILQGGAAPAQPGAGVGDGKLFGINLPTERD